MLLLPIIPLNLDIVVKQQSKFSPTFRPTLCLPIPAGHQFRNFNQFQLLPSRNFIIICVELFIEVLMFKKWFQTTFSVQKTLSKSLDSLMLEADGSDGLLVICLLLLKLKQIPSKLKWGLDIVVCSEYNKVELYCPVCVGTGSRCSFSLLNWLLEVQRKHLLGRITFKTQQ